MSKEVVFLNTWGTSRGGLSVAIGIKSKEAFLQEVEERNEKLKDNPHYGYPSYRFAEIDGKESKLFKRMTVKEFDEIFTVEDVKRMGSLMEYKASRYDRYPVFLKAVYETFGYVKEEEIEED